jgi:hypothetical protein
VSWKARLPCPTPPGGSPHELDVIPGDELLWACCGQDGQYAKFCHLCPFFALSMYQQILQKRKICLTSFHYVLNSAPFDVFMLIISITVSPARSLETMTALVAFCWLIFAGMCLFFLFPLLNRAKTVLREIISKKYDFLCDGEALKVFRIYRCHPV